MNKEQTLALFVQGREAWNAWAKKMFDYRAELERNGEWAVRRDKHLLEKPDNHTTRSWFHAAKADFAEHPFEKLANFTGFEFPAQAVFENAQFERGAAFCGTYFDRDAIFEGATFLEAVEFGNEDKFDGARFLGVCLLNRVHFCKDARFTHAYFRRMGRFTDSVFDSLARFDFVRFDEGALAWFNNATFGTFASFSNVSFGGEVLFEAVHADRAFTLKGAQFANVPNFTQAHFSEAPRLDDVVVPEVYGINQILWPLLKGIEADKETSARFRALKRLAIQAHDHTREQDYFASELKALRGYPDVLVPCPLNALRRDDHDRRLPIWPGGVRGSVRYLIGLLYEVFSDFGRSMLLPLLWWLFATGAFVWSYLQYAGNGDKCGDSTPLRAAIGLSIRKALPFAGVASTEKLNQIYACLYGTTSIDGRAAPLIPDAVDYLGILQLLLSLVLIFLFLLAVRNHFRIR